MKAAITDGCGNLCIREIGMSEMRTPYDMLCENLYCATCVGTDLHIIDGKFDVLLNYPTILGHESIARVVEIGSKVRNFRPGDLVTRVGCPSTDAFRAHWGGFSEFGIARDHAAMRSDDVRSEFWEPYLVNMYVPEGLISPKNATMIINWRETMSFIHRLGVGAGSRVLISGSGANGLCLGCMSRLFGADEVVLIGNPNRKEKAIEAGFTEMIPYDQPDEKERFVSRRKGYFDFVIDATGKNGSMDPVLACLRADGCFTCYGRDDYANYAINPFAVGASFRIYDGGYEESEVHEEVLKWIRQGKLKAELWIDKEYAFKDINQAYADAKNRRILKASIKIR